MRPRLGIILTTTLLLADPSPTATSSGGTVARVDPREGGLDVELGEWAVTMEAGAIRPGRVTFVVTNHGTVNHGFEIQSEGEEGITSETRARARRAMARRPTPPCPSRGSPSGRGAFGSDPIGQGATFERTFGQAGSSAYLCAIHPSMEGTIGSPAEPRTSEDLPPVRWRPRERSG